MVFKCKKFQKIVLGSYFVNSFDKKLDSMEIKKILIYLFI